MSFWERLLNEAYAWDVVVVDHYDYTVAALKPLVDCLHAHTIGCVQLEDHPRKFYDKADVIVCPGFSGEGLDLDVFGEGKVCAGLSYTLLRPEFSSNAFKAAEPMGALPKIAVMLGGTDPALLMPRVLDALFLATEGHCAPCVIAPSGGNHEVLHHKLGRFDRHTFHLRLSGAAVAGCFHACDYGITACGGTVYEMAALGVPFIGLCVAENQQKTAHFIERIWNLPVIALSDFSDASFLAAWKELSSEHPSGKSFYAAIDSLGPERVLSAIIRKRPTHGSTQVDLRG